MTDPDEKPKPRPEIISRIRPRQATVDSVAVSGAHPRSPSLTEAVNEAVRGALELALANKGRVVVALRGDPARGLPVRMIEGVVVGLSNSSDGRERVVIEIAEDASQVVLVERILRVMADH